MHKYIRLLLASALVLTIIVPLQLYPIPLAQKLQPEFADRADTPGWYLTAEGVLHVDFDGDGIPDEKPLYPYFHGRVRVSISRFGEKINPFAEGIDPKTKIPRNVVGFEYTGIGGSVRDPIAADPTIKVNRMIQGWKLIITYKKTATLIRQIWAYAKFSDGGLAGSPIAGLQAPACTTTGDVSAPCIDDGWIRFPYNTFMEDSQGMDPRGGRKTNGRVVTREKPIIIYSGPRRLIVAVQNDIFDGGLKLATLTIIFDFNKDKKEVIEIKDVKLRLEKHPNTIKPEECADPDRNRKVDRGLTVKVPWIPGFGTVSLGPPIVITGPKSAQTGLACFQLLNDEQLDRSLRSIF